MTCSVLCAMSFSMMKGISYQGCFQNAGTAFVHCALLINLHSIKRFYVLKISKIKRERVLIKCTHLEPPQELDL